MSAWKFTTFEPNGSVTDLPRDAILQSTFKVGRYSCTIVIDCGGIQPGGSPGVGSMTVRWSPDLPNKLNKKAIEEYRAGRNALYAMAANVIGSSILVAE